MSDAIIVALISGAVAIVSGGIPITEYPETFLFHPAKRFAVFDEEYEAVTTVSEYIGVGELETARREMEFSAGRISFNAAEINAGITDNGALIPYRIYGYKGAEQ